MTQSHGFGITAKRFISNGNLNVDDNAAGSS